MKKVFSFFGIIVLLAVIGFSMAACNDNLKGTTWKGEGQIQGFGFISTITFTASEYQQVTTSRSMPSVQEKMKGTYKFDGKSGTLTPNDGSGYIPFEVNSNKLTLGNGLILIQQ